MNRFCLGVLLFWCCSFASSEQAEDLNMEMIPTQAEREIMVKGPSEQTQKAVDLLKANLDAFVLGVSFLGDNQEPYGTIGLATTMPDMSKTPPHWLGGADLGKEGASKVIDFLAKSGFFDRATAIPIANQDFRVKFFASRKQPFYAWTVGASYKDPQYHEILGWDREMLQRLDALRKVLDGEPAKLMDQLLARLEPKRKQWEKASGRK